MNIVILVPKRKVMEETMSISIKLIIIHYSSYCWAIKLLLTIEGGIQSIVILMMFDIAVT